VNLTLENQIWELCDLAEGVDCPLYLSRRSHREAIARFTFSTGFFGHRSNMDDPEFLRDLIGESITPRELAEWLADHIKTGLDNWAETNSPEDVSII